MRADPEQRAVQLAEYIVERGATVRAAAAAFGCSKSTVHKDVAVRLRSISPALYGQVRAVLDYALTAVAPEKIFMGIPLYGYDWPLPFVSGKTRAESLSPVQAVERALRHDIAIQYDVAAQAPYYHYTDRGGREHAVWFEDARSIEAKLRLADEYHLQGVGYWNLTRPFPQNWAVLASLFDIETLL